MRVWIVAGIVLGLLGGAEARESRATCVERCTLSPSDGGGALQAIERCVTDGKKPKACRRRILKQCRRESADAVCGPPGFISMFAQPSRLYTNEFFPQATDYVQLAIRLTSRTPRTVAVDRAGFVVANATQSVVLRAAEGMTDEGRDNGCAAAVHVAPPYGDVFCYVTFRIPTTWRTGAIWYERDGFIAYDTFTLSAP